MSDPTMDLVNALKRADPKEWGKIVDNVPIFRAHKWWQRKTSQGTEAKTTLPGEPDLDTADGWILCYEVTEDDLGDVTEKINRTFEESGDPLKLLIGHTDTGQKQEDQPALAGYGVQAKVGTWGPKNTPGILVKKFYRKGYEDAVSEYPQRSPEFSRLKKTITGVALLKTDPRLPMGFTGYAEDDMAFYGVGFMAEEFPKKEEPKPAAPAAPVAAAPAAPVAPAAAPVQGPATPAAAIAQELAPLTPEEASQAMRYMNHWKQTDPMMKYMCDQFTAHAQQKAAMVAPSATNGGPATPIGKEKSPEHRMEEGDEQMQDLEEKRLYEERVLALETENARLYADKQYETMSRKRKIADAKKFKGKLVELRINPAQKMEDRDKACKEFLDDVLQNYAVVEKAPVGNHFLPIPHEEPDAPTGDEKIDSANLQVDEVAEITKYAENNKIDLVADDGWDKAFDGWVETKKKKQKNQPVRQTA